MADTEPVTGEPDAAASGAYELLSQRLAGYASDLASRAQGVNAERVQTFGSSRFEVIGTERIRTEHNSVPRDIVAVGDDLLFGYNVSLGLKPETDVDDVFTLHHYSTEDDELRLNVVPDTDQGNWLHDDEFVEHFRELYRFYQEARLVQLQQRDGKLLAAFQIGSSVDDVRVFRWTVSPDGDVAYIDNRGERDYARPNQFDFEWSLVTRDDFTTGRNPYVNILDRVFVDPTNGTLTIRIENNTPDGQLLLTETVENAEQSLADSQIEYASLGDIIVLRVRPYNEPDFRGFVVNTLAGTARRNDAILRSGQQLPEDHGLITSAGFELRSGDSRQFDLDVTDMRFETSRKSPNGEDVLYVFHDRNDGLSVLLSYNAIRREVSNPILAHGWSLFEDGTLIVFREDAEPTRVHPTQIWATPFTSDEYHARQPIGDTPMHRIGNAELVRGISDALSIGRQISDATPTSAVYADLSTSAARVLDAHHWLTEADLGNLGEPLNGIRDTAGLIIDEFEKVETLRTTARSAVDEARSDIDKLLNNLNQAPPTDADGHVTALRELRAARGRVITMADIRYVDTEELDALESELVDGFDRASANAAEFFALPESFAEFKTVLTELETKIGAASTTVELAEPEKQTEELAEGIDVLAQVVTGLKIEDPTVRIKILEHLSEVTAGVNRVRAIAAARSKELKTAEGSAAFSVEMTLFAQAVTSELSRATTPAATEEGLGRLLLQLEEIESRFAEFDAELDEIVERREVVNETFFARKQGLLDDRQRQGQRLLDAADRVLKGIVGRIERFENIEEMNAWFISDPMVEKVRELAEDLRDLDQAVAADELLARLTSAKDDAGRSLRDRSDIFEDGGKVIRLGNHRFSVDTEPLELTSAVFDGALYATLTGTDFRQALDTARLDGTEEFWDQRLASETPTMSRAQFLAGSIVLDALEAGTIVELQERSTEDLSELVQQRAQDNIEHGYERGVHDHDAALLTRAIAATLTTDLIRFSPTTRGDAWIFRAQLDDDAAIAIESQSQSLGALRDEFDDHNALDTVRQQLADAMAASGRVTSPDQSAHYLTELLAQRIDPTHGRMAHDVADAVRSSRSKQLIAELEAVTDFDRRLGLATQWVEAQIAASSADPAIAREAVALVLFPELLTGRTDSTDMTVTVPGLLATHPTIDAGTWSGRADELLDRVAAYRAVGMPRFRAYQAARAELLEDVRYQLRLEEFQPKVMSAFVRNQLIDKVYLPLIGDNLAKQIGSLDGGRTDLMGLLLLISPPGYGKTTLMEYVANRLGMVFVKVNGPAMGTGVTSLDPSEAPNATAAQEVDKINFALEMGSNVLLYLDDIQHTNPELLQKFISMTDAQRRMEGMWNGRTRTYDMRGKRFAVVMAGNPYTESGERFAIPDMLANRADTYNLGDVLSGRDDLFALSYIENALAASPILNAMTSHDLSDVAKLVDIVHEGATTAEDLSHPYPPSELAEMTATMSRLLRVQDVLLAVNGAYIDSASKADEYRVEPPFLLQGSYRNMARLAEKVLPIMDDAEIEALLDDHYRGEAQTLTSDAEANLLKLGELRDNLDDDQKARWGEIVAAFRSAHGGDGPDPTVRMADSLDAISSSLKAGGAQFAGRNRAVQSTKAFVGLTKTIDDVGGDPATVEDATEPEPDEDDAKTGDTSTEQP